MFCGLFELHNINFVHRDIRWPNVVWVREEQRWKLIDLDWGAGFSGEEPAKWPGDSKVGEGEEEKFVHGIKEQYLPEPSTPGHWTCQDDCNMALKNLVDGWWSAVTKRWPSEETRDKVGVKIPGEGELEALKDELRRAWKESSSKVSGENQVGLLEKIVRSELEEIK